MSRLFETPMRPPPRPAVAERGSRPDLSSGSEEARALQQRLGAAHGVTAIRYERQRRGDWLVEHGRAGDDYFFQLHPLRVLARPWQDIVTALIAVMDGVFPRSVQIHYKRPDEQWSVNFYTVKAEHLCRLPGWESAITRAIAGIGSVSGWGGP
jgi:hypothetical protein